VWESNPPPTCLEPDAGFEVREAHRDPRRLRAGNYLMNQRWQVYHPQGSSPRCHRRTPKLSPFEGDRAASLAPASRRSASATMA
jgi:hypothetical protein